MTSQPDVLQKCLEKVAQESGPALERALDDAIVALQSTEAETKNFSERSALRNAWRGLQEDKSTRSQQYSSQLLILFRGYASQAAQAAVEASDELSEPGESASLLSRSSTPQLFSLVEDADVSKAIESARMLQQVASAVESTLELLDKLISSVLGLENIRPDLNPLRPEAFTQTLHKVIFSAPADATSMVLWSRHLTPPFARELRQIYEQAVRQLKAADIKEASYRLLPKLATRGNGPLSPSAEASGTAVNSPPASNTTSSNSQSAGANPATGLPMNQSSGMSHPLLSHEDIRGEMLQNFVQEGGSQVNYGLSHAYYAAIDEELRFLMGEADSALDTLQPPSIGRHEIQRIPVVDRPVARVNAQSQLNENTWGIYGRAKERSLVRIQLKKKAERFGQVLGLEVVRQLVNQVAQDPRLLAPVREAIIALEPSLLRLAMVDVRFFSDERHPGRQLMERVAQRSFRYNDELSADFSEFFGQIIEIFKALNGQEIDDSEPFAQALATLENQWHTSDALEEEKRHDAVRTLRFAEERQLQAESISAEIMQRTDLNQVPGIILNFLSGPWALAMAHARLINKEKQIDPLGLGAVISDLLWSVKRESILRQPGKLIQMIPSLVKKLNQGLDLIGQAPQTREDFFDRLMRLHGPVLNLRRVKTQRDSEESGAMALESEQLYDGSSQDQPRPAQPLWLGQHELDAAGFQDTLATGAGELSPLPDSEIAVASSEHGAGALGELFPRTSESKTNQNLTPSQTAELNTIGAAAISSSEAEKILQALHTGDWIDLYSRQQWLRAELVWSSAKGALFMFVSQGGQPHSMTKRSCERLIRDRLLRPVANHGVVEHALQAVITAPELAQSALSPL